MRVGIVGAGIMGRLMAFSLANAGWHVTLFDKDNFNSVENCSMAAAGLLTPVAELDKSEPVIFNLGADALLQYWPQIIKQLDENIYFRQLGSLLLAHPHDKEEMERIVNIITKKFTQQNPFQKLTQEDIQSFEPEISKFDHGYYFAQEGQIDNQSIMNSLFTYLKNKNITWRANTVVRDISPGKVIAANESEIFDLVLDCRGLGAKSAFQDLRGIRGEVIWLHAPDVNIQRPIRVTHPRYSIYLVPRPNNIYILGASEIESEDRSAISVRSTMELLSAAYYVHAGFAEARIVKTITHCRPTLADHLPKMKFADGVVSINGLYRHGFLIAPTLANEVMRWVEKGISAVCYPQLWEQIHDYH